MPTLRSLFDAQDGRCWYCTDPMTYRARGHKPNGASKEHLLPKSRGGSGRRINLVAACRACNCLKANKTEAEFRLKYPSVEAIKAARGHAMTFAARAKKRAAKRAKSIAIAAVAKGKRKHKRAGARPADMGMTPSGVTLAERLKAA